MPLFHYSYTYFLFKNRVTRPLQIAAEPPPPVCEPPPPPVSEPRPPPVCRRRRPFAAAAARLPPLPPVCRRRSSAFKPFYSQPQPAARGSRLDSQGLLKVPFSKPGYVKLIISRILNILCYVLFVINFGFYLLFQLNFFMFTSSATGREKGERKPPKKRDLRITLFSWHQRL